jgi:hypothetical protein
VSRSRAAGSYVLPLSWDEDSGLAELTSYLGALEGLVDDVVVVDASPQEVFERHAEAFGGRCRHLRPHDDLRYRMGKVNGVVTGVREARHERVVIADDDVRYVEASLARTAALLAEAELVRPQNFFEPLTWHARWDTARSLLNRVWSGDPREPCADFPGTLAVRRSFFCEIGAYDGDVLFENLELIRTVRAAGGRVLSPLDVYVARRPPSTRHFLGQRVRQAYDDLALPLRMATYLALAPLGAAAALRGGSRRPAAVARRAASALLAASAGAIALAEAGRRRAGGRAVFPATASLLAPAWALERAVCSWLAVGERVLHGGVRYRGGRLSRAATSERRLRARYSGGASGGAGPVAAIVAGAGSDRGPLGERKPVSL